MSITIDGTTGISGVAGTASTPAVQGEDTNTGVFFPAADTVAVATAGAERMRVNSSGNVGIGTTSPSAPLNVALYGTNSTTPTSSGAVIRVEQGPFGSSETSIQVVARDATSGAAIHFGRASESQSTRIASFGASSGLLIQENSGGPISFWTSGGEAVRVTAAGVLQFNSGYGSVAPVYGCRAWVNFNGIGTVAIRASGNVSSITDNGVGDYTINFATAMPDANYSYSHSYSAEVNVQHTIGFLETISSGSLRVRHFNAANSANSADKSFVSIAVFR